MLWMWGMVREDSTVLKSLYGIKEARREFNILLPNVLTEIGLEQSAADLYPLRLMCDGDVCAFVGSHADDLMVGGEAKVLEWLKSRVQEYLEISDLGNLSIYVGCEIVRNRNARTNTMTQTRYILDMVKLHVGEGEFGAVPYVPSRRLDGHQEDDWYADVPYRTAVGSLQWAAIMTRPDIANVVREVARYCDEPKRVHWRAVLSIMRYLNAFPLLGVTYGGVEKCVLSAYTDASFGGNSEGRQSVTGRAVMFCGGAVSMMSKLQKVVALSTTESELLPLEYIRACATQLPTIVSNFEDNDGACKLSRSATSTGRTKHIDVRHHFLRDLVKRSG
ncbi:unnamed protein product [Discosporangium mesarthrocarpum]